jgi:hypothetical protein
MDANAMNEQAVQLAIEDFKREYQSAVCAVCKSEKWINSPFCRSCSIKLQRVRMMARLSGLVHEVQYEVAVTGKQESDWRFWPEWILKAYWRYYDICRDYLLDVKRHFESRVRRTKDRCTRKAVKIQTGAESNGRQNVRSI